MSDVKDLLDNEIYPRLDRAEALRDLDPQDKGGYFLLTCPNCRKREAFIYKAGEYITCNRRDKCGFSQSLWDYVQGSRGLNNQETLRELARLAGYTLPDLDPEALERLERARAEKLRKYHHPRKANRLYLRADDLEAVSWLDVARWLGTKGKGSAKGVSINK